MRGYIVLVSGIVLAGLSYFIRAGFFAGAGIDLVFMVVVPVLVLLGLKVRLKDAGLQAGDWRKGLQYFAVLLVVAIPIMMYGASLAGFKDYYPIWRPATYSLRNFLIFEAVIGATMFATEFLFRGFLLFGMKNKYANLIQAVVYTFVHVGKPGLEVPYSFLAGYVFGYADLKCKSILPSFLMHFISSIIFDLMVLYL